MRSVMMTRPWLVAALIVLAPVAARAQPAPETPPEAPPPAAIDPLQEARDLVESAPNTRENLKRAIGIYEDRLKDTSLSAKVRADGYADESRAWLRLGDLESSDSAHIADNEKGQAAGKKGEVIDPKNTEALFWDTANLAVIGRTKGVMNSLFMVGDLRKGLGRVLELNPNHFYAKQTLAEIDHKVPGFAGGSDERAEAAYLDILKKDPYFTPTMANIAEFYRDNGKKDDARKWATACVNAPHSSVPNDWKKFDKHDCQVVLKDIE